MVVSFKKLLPGAVTPAYAKSGDAGMDLTAIRVISEVRDQIIYGTGIAVEIPEGYVGLVFPRSSIRKYDLALSNSVGVIDSGYRGEIQFTFNKTKSMNSSIYRIGDKIGQLIILPYPTITLVETDELSETERGTGGHGSTGN